MKIWKQIVDYFLSFFQKPQIDPGPYPLSMASKELRRTVFIELYLPPNQSESWSLLLINDGQDAQRLSLASHYQSFRQKSPLMIAAIHAGNRLEEYGTAGQLDYKNRGKNAESYQRFIIQELLVYLHKNFPITANPQKVGIAGFSLGGLSAVDIAWNYPKIFGLCGIFSGALWWRSKPFLPKDPDANRIIHDQVIQGVFRNQRFWLQAGTADELEDRNNNGVIDAIDDTIHLMNLLKLKIPSGHETAWDNHYLKYVEVENGKHDPETWGRVFPDFLGWAFPNI